MTPFALRTLGATGLRVGPLGLGSSFGLPGVEVERAFERGVRFFLWGSLRRRSFGRGLRAIARRDRAGAVVAIQTYARAAWTIPWSVDRALRALDTDYVDVLGLAWWNGPPPARIVDRALELKARGKVRHVMISCHERSTLAQLAGDPRYEALMVRYNAAHPGAEREVFPFVERSLRRPGVVSFTATRWATLLDPRLTPPGVRTPTAGDCYRFALSHPSVDVCLAGPKDAAQLDEALAAVDRGAMEVDELAWMRRVGAHVRETTRRAPRGAGMRLLDALSTCGGPQAPALPPAR